MDSQTLLIIFLLLNQAFCKTAFRNVAIKKPTKQSSSPHARGDSSHAVDNNTDSVFDHRSCTHTDFSAIEWWCVDLQHVYIINNIKLYNRATNQERLRGFTMKLSNTGQCNGAGFNSASPCYKDNSQQDHSVYNITECNQLSSTLSGRFVFIQNRPNQALALCEVQIYKGGCPNGTFGVDCEGQCNTNCKDRCDRCNGTCINGCIYGKSGEHCDKNCNDNCIHCKQDNINSCTQCKDGRWGTSCHEICSFNCKPPDDSVISLCDRMTGSCSNGCQTGKTGSDCFKDKSEQSKSEGISPVVGGIIGALFGITVTSLICITGFCYYIKRKLPRQPAREPPGYRYNNRPDTCVSPVLTRENTYDTSEQASNDHGDVADPYYKTLEQVPVYVNLGRE